MYELNKYRHEWNGDGELVVYDVPVFAETERDINGKLLVFDRDYCERAIQNAQTLFEINKGYMAPFHEEHNSLQPSNDPIVRKNLGRFLPKRLKEVTLAEVNKFTEEVESAQKHIVIADLVIKPEHVEAFDRGDYPYLSVEIKNPDFPEFSSLAALTSRPPEHKFSPLAIMPVQFAEDGSYHCYFSEERIMPLQAQQTEQFGVQDLAKKISQNWWSIKGKLASDPTFNKLINIVNSNMSNLDPTGKAKGHRGGEVNISPDVIASWLQSVPSMVGKLAGMFSEEEQQFGLLGDIHQGYKEATANPNLKVFKTEAPKYVEKFKSAKDYGEQFYWFSKLKERLTELGLGAKDLKDFPDISKIITQRFSEGDGMEKDQQFANPNIQSAMKSNKHAIVRKLVSEELEKVFKDVMNTASGLKYDPEQVKDAARGWARFAEGENQVDEKKPEQMANGDPLADQQMADGSTIEQITALLPSASEEILAQILQLLQGGSQMADGDEDLKMMPSTSSFNAQFAAESKKRRSIEEKLQLGFDLLNKRISAIEDKFERKEALQFAELTLTKEGVSQRDQILKDLEKKPASEIKERVAFVSKYAGKDPAPMRSHVTADDPEIEELKAQYPGRESLVLQFADYWKNNTGKTMPVKKFVRLQIEGYKPQQTPVNQ